VPQQWFIPAAVATPGMRTCPHLLLLRMADLRMARVRCCSSCQVAVACQSTLWVPPCGGLPNDVLRWIIQQLPRFTSRQAAGPVAAAVTRLKHARDGPYQCSDELCCISTHLWWMLLCSVSDCTLAPTLRSRCPTPPPQRSVVPAWPVLCWA